MKDVFMPLFSLLALNSSHPTPNNDQTNLSIPQDQHVLATFSVPAPAPLFTHHGHHGHEHEHEQEHHHTSNHRHYRRPEAGKASSSVRPSTRSTLTDAKDLTCPSPPVLSCSSQAQSVDDCCVVRPGGVLVHTQFWDLGIGEENMWGIHGLWPDLCTGSGKSAYYESCDNSRAYSGSQITSALQNAGQSDLLEYMKENWQSDDESSEDFWAHEWKTHGTCVSTLDPKCFDNYQTAQEVVPYFEEVVALFKQLNTYQALANADPPIVPDNSKTYDLMDMQNAVSDATGYTPDFTCTDGNQLESVYYYLNAQGPLQDGQLTQSTASDVRDSTCPDTGIRYPVKTVGNKQRK